MAARLVLCSVCGVFIWRETLPLSQSSDNTLCKEVIYTLSYCYLLLIIRRHRPATFSDRFRPYSGSPEINPFNSLAGCVNVLTFSMPKDTYIVTLAMSKESPNRYSWLLRLRCEEHLRNASTSELCALAVEAHKQAFGDSGLSVGHCNAEICYQEIPQDPGEPRISMNCGCQAWGSRL